MFYVPRSICIFEYISSTNLYLHRSNKTFLIKLPLYVLLYSFIPFITYIIIICLQKTIIFVVNTFANKEFYWITWIVTYFIINFDLPSSKDEIQYNINAYTSMRLYIVCNICNIVIYNNKYMYFSIFTVIFNIPNN